MANLKIYLEDGELKVSGSINLGYIGSFIDSQIEIDDSLDGTIKQHYLFEL